MGKVKTSSYSNKGQEYFFKAPLTDNQRRFLYLMDNKQVVIAHGPAGTGKTMFALQTALKQLDMRFIDKIWYVRNDTYNKFASKPMGALPGDAKEKMLPLLGPILDNLDELCSPGKAKYLIDNGQIEAIPFEFLRGRSLANSFIIVDEAQNTTPEAIKMALTRISRNSQMVLIGDTRQKDSLDRFDDGLKDAVDKLYGLESVGIVEFTLADIKRSGIVIDILSRYETKPYFPRAAA